MMAINWLTGLLTAALGCFLIGVSAANAQAPSTAAEHGSALNNQEIALVRISAHTATGNQQELDTALRAGLDAGLTVHQIKTALEQLYAYCGFPRSLNGINTFRAVMASRAEQGVQDALGPAYAPMAGGDRYERGRATLERLTGRPQAKPAPGLGEFSPEIDRFLKEHLFADIFDNPLLTHKQREFVTITALASMPGLASQLKSHIGIGKNTGITDAQLVEIADLVDAAVSRTQANELRQLIAKPALPVTDKDMLVRISEIRIAPESRTEYLSILEREARQSVQSEPGVVSIFPMVRADDPTQVRIVEIYRNRPAYEAHIASPHFQHYKTSTQQMVKSLHLVDMQAIDAQSMPAIFGKLR